MNAERVKQPLMSPFTIPSRSLASLLNELGAYGHPGISGLPISRFSDLTIRFEGIPGVSFHVHKCIMVAAIPFFANMGDILNSQEQESDTPCLVTFDPAIVSPASFHLILSCILRGMPPRIGDNEAALRKACGFLLMENGPERFWGWFGESQGDLSFPRISNSVNAPPETVWWIRNLARQRERGEFCDLAISITTGGGAARRFQVHKCVVATAFTGLEKLYPNFTDVSEVELSGSEVEPKAFETMLRYVYVARYEIIDGGCNFFHLLQACVYLGCCELAIKCCDALMKWIKENAVVSDAKKSMLEFCFKLWRYGRALSQADGWMFPLRFCNAFLTMLLCACKSFVYNDYTESSTLQRFTYCEILDLLTSFHPNSILQSTMLFIAAAWLRHAPEDRIKYTDSLLVYVEPVDWSQFSRIDREQLEKSGVMHWLTEKQGVKPTARPWRRLIVQQLRNQPGGYPRLSEKDSRLQHMFMAHLLGQTTGVVDDQRRVHSFEPSGRILFTSGAFKSAERHPFRRLVSFQGRLFGICHHFGGKYKFWGCELLKNGKKSGGFYFNWPWGVDWSGKIPVVLLDRQYVYIGNVNDKRNLHCCVYSLSDVAAVKSLQEVVPVAHSLHIPLPDVVGEKGGPCASPSMSPVDGTLFLAIPTQRMLKHGVYLTRFHIRSYEVGTKKRANHLPDLPDISPNSLQLASCNGSLFAGFAHGRHDDFGRIMLVLENSPRWQIWVLKPGSLSWEPFQAPNLVYSSADKCRLFCAGTRLFVTGYEHWGGPLTTKSFDLNEDSVRSAMGWTVHLELRDYEYPKQFLCLPDQPQCDADGCKGALSAAAQLPPALLASSSLDNV